MPILRYQPGLAGMELVVSNGTRALRVDFRMPDGAEPSFTVIAADEPDVALALEALERAVRVVVKKRLQGWSSELG